MSAARPSRPRPTGTISPPAPDAGRLEIRRAVSAEDLGFCSSILCRAAAWLSDRGMPLWNPADLSPEALCPAYERGELLLARRGTHPVGVFLLQEEDRFFWPDVPSGESLFLHRLAVERDAAGQGVAQAMLTWAAAEAAQCGKEFLRLDCDGTRPRLIRFYVNAGFALRDVREMGRWSAARFEMSLVRPLPDG